MRRKGLHPDPVSPAAIAEAGGIHVGELPPGFGDVRGLYYGEWRGIRLADQHILLQDDLRETSRRFVFAHEVAHAAAQAARGRVGGRFVGQYKGRRGEVDFYECSDPVEELIANRVALEVLMPADLVLHEVMTARSVRPYALARRFGVTITRARQRLRALGLMEEKGGRACSNS